MQVTLSRALLTAALLGGGSAGAAVIDTHAFTLDGVPFDPFVEIALTADTAGSATFALTGIGQQLHSSVAAPAGTDASHDLPWQNIYDITVKDGYRVTGITVTGSFQGRLAPSGDAAGNDISLSFQAWQPGSAPIWSPSATASALDGRHDWSIGTGPATLDGQFLLGFLGYASSHAQGLAGAGASAGIGIENLVMTVNVAPVPEPQAWLMLLAGMAALGVTRRRVLASRNVSLR